MKAGHAFVGMTRVLLFGFSHNWKQPANDFWRLIGCFDPANRDMAP
jgi:hypothetical protein